MNPKILFHSGTLYMSSYKDHTDPELLAVLRCDKEIAFREIYQRYSNRLFNYVRQRVSDREDCKELIQEVFEMLWQREGEILYLGPFLFTMLKFRITNYYDHKKVKRKFSDYMKLFQEETDGVEEEFEIERLRLVINRSMANLPTRCRDALKLRIDENLSLDDIARRMEIDKRSVKRYLTMAMNYFRKTHPPLYRSK